MSATSRSRGPSAFTILELMIVVSVIGLLAVLAIPAAWRARMRAQNSAFINDLRVVTDAAFEQYAITYGNYPPNAGPGAEPDGIRDLLPRSFSWTGKNSIGGLWDWDRAPTRADKLYGCYAGLSVFEPARTSAQMREIDRAIDDGNLETGKFRSRADGYIYILEE
jgi:prepilin-type N-terminal cleavage/methylation domain-containing protein